MRPDIFPHVIQQQTVELVLEPGLDYSSIEERVKTILSNSLPEMDAVLSQYDDPDSIVKIDRLNIDLGIIQADQLEDILKTDLYAAISNTLKEKLAQLNTSARRNISSKIEKENRNDGNPEDPIPKTFENLIYEKGKNGVNPVEYSTIREGLEALFLHFLRTGVLPWWVTLPAGTDFKSVFTPVFSRPSSGFVRKLQEVLRNDSSCIQRIIYQFPKPLYTRIFTLLIEPALTEVRDFNDNFWAVIRASDYLPDQRKKLQEDQVALYFWLSIVVSPDSGKAGDTTGLLLKYLSGKNFISAVQVQNIFVKINESHSVYKNMLSKQYFSSDDSSNFNTISKNTTHFNIHDDRHLLIPVSIASTRSNELETNGFSEKTGSDLSLYAPYAGLILLHPFLTQLFSALGFLDGKQQFVNESSQYRAVGVLGYLATGKLNLPEFELPFCKLLCGIPYNKPVYRISRLKKTEIDACEELLQAVIRHWSILKNTSPEALQETFLRRNAKIEFTENAFVVLMEKNSLDILLDRLPWSIQYAYLPWIHHTITIIWN